MLRALAVAAAILPMGAIAGETLFDAVSAGDTASIERLLAQGADVNSRDRDRATPLIAAALNNQPNATRLLLTKGADVMARNSGGFTSLHAAAYSGSVEVATVLLERGASLDDTANKAGVTPLMVASEENHPAVIELLLSKGADGLRPDLHGYTPLTRAFWRGRKDIVEMLKNIGGTCQSADVLGSEALYRQCIEIGK